MSDSARRAVIVGCGWFGLPFAQRLRGLGWHVAGSVRDPLRARALSALEIEGFVLDLADASFPGPPFAEAVVVVAIPPGRRRGRSGYDAGAIRLIDHALASGCRAIAHIGSTSIYEGLSGDLDEDSQPLPGDQGQVAVERHLADLPAPTCAVRFGGLIGPGRHPGRFLAGRTGLSGGARPVNLVHLDDCLAGMQLLLATPCQQWPARVNVVAPEHPTRADYYPAAAATLGLEPPTFAGEEALPADARVVGSRWLGDQGFVFRSLAADGC